MQIAGLTDLQFRRQRFTSYNDREGERAVWEKLDRVVGGSLFQKIHWYMELQLILIIFPWL